MRRSPIVWILLFVGAYRLSLLGRGAMAFLDETMYFKAGLALDEIRTGHLSRALFHMASNNARPGNALLQTVPAALQAIPYAFGVSPSNPRSLIIPVACNAIVSLISLYLFWRISLTLFRGDRVASAVGAAMYGLLANSNVYIRHLLAYEPALCVGLGATLVAVGVRKRDSDGSAIGALSAFAVTVYPGYYLFAFIPGVAFVGLHDGTTAGRVRRGLFFAAGFGAVIAVMEMLCRLGGGSFVGAARALSGTITQGSFEEGWVFVPRYLVQVERYAGVALLAGTTACLAATIWALGGQRALRPAGCLVLPAAAAWVWQAAGSSSLHTMVLYGRLIHPWMAFMVWATLDAVNAMTSRAWRHAAHAVLLLASVVSWSTFAFEYRRVEYPSDVLYRFGINTSLLAPSQRACSLVPDYLYDSPPPLDRSSGAPYSSRDDYLLFNFCMGAPPVGRPAPIEDSPPGARLELRAPHFMSVRAYGFEGLTPGARDEMRRPVYDVRILSGVPRATGASPFQASSTGAAN